MENCSTTETPKPTKGEAMSNSKEWDLFSKESVEMAARIKEKYPNTHKLLYLNDAVPEILQFIHTELTQTHNKAVQQCLDALPEEWEEGDGWDIAFSQSSTTELLPDGTKKVTKKKQRSCCPGDDIAYTRNMTIEQAKSNIERIKL